MADRIQIQILDDGTIKSTTDPVSPENHAAADAFMKDLGKKTGGTVHREARGTSAHTHHHVDTGVTHSH